MLQAVLDNIAQRQRFGLTSHARLDGDAVGSALACCQVLRSMGKQADVVLHHAIPYIYRPLPLASEVQQATTIKVNYEVAIILECDAIERTRLDGLASLFLINIDHHLSGKPFAHVNWIDTEACATAEMIYRLCLAAGVNITPGIAICLYTGVLTDTGSFCFPGTKERTFVLAGENAPGLTRRNAHKRCISPTQHRRCGCWERRSPPCTAMAIWRGCISRANTSIAAAPSTRMPKVW